MINPCTNKKLWLICQLGCSEQGGSGWGTYWYYCIAEGDNEDEYDNYSFNYVKSTASDLSDEEILNELNDDNLTNTMLCFKAFYGDVKEIFNLERFILNTGINDLHGENTGFIYDRPVLIDYCGYFE